MPETSRSARGPVVIAGGGVAAVETLLALRASPGGDALDVMMLAPNHDLVYRPTSVGEAFGRPLVRRYSLDAICADLGAALVKDVLAAVDGERRVAVTGGGRELPFDALVVAIGARARAALPNAFTFFADTETDADGYQWIVREVEEGATRTIAFVVPPAVGWSLPLYELALLTAHRAWSVGAGDVAFTVVTPEDAPLGLFQGEGSHAVAQLLGLAGIELETSTYAHDYDGRVLRLAPGGRQLAVDRVVALPALSGPAIDGLPCDPDGFVRVDEHGRVPGIEGAYAIGDVTTFAIKQGGIATQQADVVATLIANRGHDGTVTRPYLRAILLTGREPLYLTGTITGGESVASHASRECPWWPPHKIAARHLAPYLADREQLADQAAAARDRDRI